MTPATAADLAPRHTVYGRPVWLAAAALCLCTLEAAAWDWDDADGPAAGAPESIGSYAAGCLVGGAQLPADGPGFQAIRLERNRHFGHPDLVRFVETLGRQAEAAGIGLLAVGDMSQPRGGPMSSSHASHQIGLDVDIFLRLDLDRLPHAERGEDLVLPSLVDYARRELDARFGDAQAEALHLAANAPGVERIFVSPLIKQAMCAREWPDRTFLRALRPWYGHDDHFHVRLACAPTSPACRPQAPPPPGDGCGRELEGWLETGLIPTTDSGQRRSPVLPMRCDALR